MCGQPFAAAHRRRRRYPSDMTDAEWAVCEPLLPHPAWLAGRGGRPSGYCMRDVQTALKLTLEIVKRPDDLHAFKVLPRRWVVERTLA
jgi:transposase